MSERYEILLQASSRKLHLIYPAGGFGALPDRIRHLGPWLGPQEGEVLRLKPEYRLGLARDGYILIESPIWEFRPEAESTAERKSPPQ